MAKRRLTKGVLCRDAADDLRLKGWCILFVETIRPLVYKARNGVWLGNPISSKPIRCWLWTPYHFRHEYPDVRIPKRGTCRETSLMI